MDLYFSYGLAFLGWVSSGSRPFPNGISSALCTDIAEQKWIIEEDPNGREETFRLRKCGWRNKADEKLYPEWKKFYDYNF